MSIDVELEIASPADPGPDPGRDASIGAELRRGLGLVPRAWRLLRRQRALWWPAVVPALVTAACVSVAAFLVYANAGEWLRWMQAELPWPGVASWYEWLWVGPARAGLWLLARLWVGVLAAASVGAAMLLSALLASPVLDLLSQRVERVIRGVAAGDDERLEAGLLLRDAGAAVLNEARRVAFFGGVWIAITALGLFVPLGPVIAPAALVMFAVAFLPLEYAGFALDRRRIGFAQRRRWLASHRAAALGFGGTAFALTWVPGLNFVMLPLLVTAGTLLVLERPPEAGS